MIIQGSNNPITLTFSEDILRLGEHYFKDLKANWVMASVYQQWLTARNLPTPPWFRNE